MTRWQKPSFEELAMNAEIGGYQSDDGDGDRYNPPFVHSAPDARRGSRVPYLVAAFLEVHGANELTARYG